MVTGIARALSAKVPVIFETSRVPPGLYEFIPYVPLKLAVYVPVLK
jgi:hypothetical protein